MSKFYYKIQSWLLPIMIVLFILEIFTFPFVLNITYADRSENPDHFLTYTTNKLRWDYNTSIKPNGVAELSLFDIMYEADAKSHNGDKIIAPGLNNKNIIRFKNSSDKKIQYVAVLYKYDTTEDIPIVIDFKNDDLVNAREYYLPDELEDVNVIRAVTGTLKSNKIQDFDIGWKWRFYVSDTQDRKDTFLGNKEILDETKVGFYLVVKDSSSTDEPGGGGGGIVIRPPKDEDPDNPNIPDTPDNPDIPDEPDIPDILNEPDVPDTPDNPEQPDNPNTPDIPDIPDVPDTPDNPEQPDNLNTPDIPDVPDKPGESGEGSTDGEDTGSIIKPEVPKTGDKRLFEMYITLMFISAIVLIIMIIERRLEKRQK